MVIQLHTQLCCVIVFFFCLSSGRWRLDCNDLGNRVQTCRPSKAAFVQRGWYRRQGQGMLNIFPTQFDTFYTDKEHFLYCSWFLFFCPLGGEHLPTLGGFFWQCWHCWTAPECTLWSSGCEHPWRLSTAHRCSGKPTWVCHVSFCFKDCFSNTPDCLLELQLKMERIKASNVGFLSEAAYWWSVFPQAFPELGSRCVSEKPWGGNSSRLLQPQLKGLGSSAGQQERARQEQQAGSSRGKSSSQVQNILFFSAYLQE